MTEHRLHTLDRRARRDRERRSRVPQVARREMPNPCGLDGLVEPAAAEAAHSEHAGPWGAAQATAVKTSQANGMP